MLFRLNDLIKFGLSHQVVAQPAIVLRTEDGVQPGLSEVGIYKEDTFVANRSDKRKVQCDKRLAFSRNIRMHSQYLLVAEVILQIDTQSAERLGNGSFRILNDRHFTIELVFGNGRYHREVERVSNFIRSLDFITEVFTQEYRHYKKDNRGKHCCNVVAYLFRAKQFCYVRRGRIEHLGIRTVRCTRDIRFGTTLKKKCVQLIVQIVVTLYANEVLLGFWKSGKL